MAETLAGPGARAPPPLPDHLVEEILVRVASPADLARAAAACTSFRRLVADASFLRRYRCLHPPLLLGVLEAQRFLPAGAGHPNALAADALVRAADFSHCQGIDWTYCDAHGGRVLLRRSDLLRRRVEHIFPELAVCDPLTRGHMPLPTIPEGLVASALGLVRREHIGNFMAFFVPAADYEEAQFRVVVWTYCEALGVAFVFSSLSGTWSDGISIGTDAPGFNIRQFTKPSYVYGCFYWKLRHRNKLLKLNVNMMEFSVVGLPADHTNLCVLAVEAGGGRIGLITQATLQIPELRHSIWQNDAGNENKHTMETAIRLPSDYAGGYMVLGAAEGHILLACFEEERIHSSQDFFSINIKTLEIVRVCSVPPDSCDYSCPLFLYFGYPPFLSPRRI